MLFPFNQYPYLNLTDLNLDYLLSHLKKYMQLVDSLKDWQAQHEEEYEELKALYDAIVSGQFPPAMETALKEWVERNSESIIADAIKLVFFGLSDDGYFLAFIPDSWDEITFGTTGYDDFPAGIEYGRLTLSY